MTSTHRDTASALGVFLSYVTYSSAKSFHFRWNIEDSSSEPAQERFPLMGRNDVSCDVAIFY